MKKIRTNKSNSHIALLLIDNLLNKYSLQIFDADLKRTNKINLHYLPTDLFLDDSGVYVKSSNSNTLFHKYNYSLDHIRSFGQTNDSKKPFHIPKDLTALSIENDKMFFIDYNHLKLRVFCETNGKVLQSIDFGDKNCLFYIDKSGGKIYILNENKNVIEVYNLNGVLLSEKHIEQRIQSIDAFFVSNNDQISIIDKRNHFIYMF